MTDEHLGPCVESDEDKHMANKAIIIGIINQWEI
jgi:hypothetical protein